MFGSWCFEIQFVWGMPRRTWRDWARVVLLKVAIFSIGYYLPVGLIIGRKVGGEVGVSWMQLACMVFGAMVLFTPIVELFNFFCFVASVTLLMDLLESLRNLLTEVIVFGCLLTLSYYQAPRSVFFATAGLQIFSFCILALSADFDTPLKLWMKSNCSQGVLSFLANFLKLKYFHCSNPIEGKVFKTHLFFTTGKSLSATGFTLDTFTGLDMSCLSDKVAMASAGPKHTLFTIEGVGGGILVDSSSRSDEQKNILEYIAHNPTACFVKEVRGSRGKYCSIEEYADLLSSKDIYVCTFPKSVVASSEEPDLVAFDLLNFTTKFLPSSLANFFKTVEPHRIEKNSELPNYFALLREDAFPLMVERSPLPKRHLYYFTSMLSCGLKIGWRSSTPSDGVLMV